MNDEKYITELMIFNPKVAYKKINGRVSNTNLNRATETCKMARLVSDMDAENAPLEDLLRVAKYVMVVVDCERYDLDWERAKEDFGIEELFARYQR